MRLQEILKKSKSKLDEQMDKTKEFFRFEKDDESKISDDERRKNAWLKKLSRSISFLGEADKADLISFYNESIQDKISDQGISMIEALESMGTITEITNGIYADFNNGEVIKKENLIDTKEKSDAARVARKKVGTGFKWSMKLLLEPLNLLLIGAWLMIFVAGAICTIISFLIPVYGVWAFFVLDSYTAAGLFVISIAAAPIMIMLCYVIYAAFYMLFRENICFSIWLIKKDALAITKMRRYNPFNLFKIVTAKIWAPIMITFIVVAAALSALSFTGSKPIFSTNESTYANKIEKTIDGKTLISTDDVDLSIQQQVPDDKTIEHDYVSVFYYFRTTGSDLNQIGETTDITIKHFDKFKTKEKEQNIEPDKYVNYSNSRLQMQSDDWTKVDRYTDFNIVIDFNLHEDDWMSGMFDYGELTRKSVIDINSNAIAKYADSIFESIESQHPNMQISTTISTW